MSANNTNNRRKKSNSTSSNADNPDNACVVCFKNVEIYSIGECDHPVCYECSTRMRVLCKQQECPICRQGLEKVVFTYDKLTYRELEAKNRSEYFNTEYKICFYTRPIQQAFFQLLDHPCPKCDHPVFRTFASLREHVEHEHGHFYCDLCTDNLKIFSFERRCYSKDELMLHRRKGDPDNKSHRGHPLCEYCDKRYLDRDELFRHLRREHYFCHFCDADGCNEFYKDYNALRKHFRKDHYFCEEGKCATEEFTGAFRTEIDYKAHVANVHGKSFNKQQAKQARTLQLEITLGPRGRSGQTEPHIANLRSRGHNDNEVEQQPEPTHSTYTQRAPQIDARNEQDFPSLGNGTPALSLLPLPMGLRAKLGSAGLARTKENFPALGGAESGGGAGPSASRPKQNSISSVIKKNPSSTPTGMLIHVSNRPSTSSGGATSKKPNHSNKKDFPSLPGSSKAAAHAAFREDMIASNSNINYDNVSAKHRSLMDDYVSVANPNNFHKLQLVQKEAEEAKAKKAAFEASAPKLDSIAFPALSMGSKAPAPAQPSWTKSQKQQREAENRKSKVAPAPLLNMNAKQKNSKYNVQNGNSGNNSNSNNNNNNTSTENQNSNKKEKKNKNAGTEGKKSPGAPPPPTSHNNKHQKKDNNNENKPANANANPSVIKPAPVVANGNVKNTQQQALNEQELGPRRVAPPPGFSPLIKPPPGFQNVTLNSVAKSPNSLTFTSSMGESYNIVPTHSYMQPPEAITRNQKLVGHFKDALKTPEALEEFRKISQRFREGVVKSQSYYEHCQAALRDRFGIIFPELLSLLPDINKQQELYLVHSQRLKSLPGDQKKSNDKLEVCSTCKQVLLVSDADNHFKLHAMRESFPTLGNSDNKGNNALTANRK
ncbi:E3 ubiquitin-protein ligase ZNF598 [Eupeodes corollae]|uniref:E3 ubiquitin-protein ligase ZNF598 n=1 Tax=Eupeodes corollae TaxID=290404 RepID=UPI002493ABF0|nr:E3 ubiquitin-protein ligase ZNF598 [Eupeodes corollae]